jgi:hypothetical protein
MEPTCFLDGENSIQVAEESSQLLLRDILGSYDSQDIRHVGLLFTKAGRPNSIGDQCG